MDAIYGRHAVAEMLRARRRTVYRLLQAEGAETKGVLAEILRAAVELGVPIERVKRSQLDGYNRQHQGVVALAEPYPYAPLEDVQAQASQRGEPLLVLLLDQLQDPQNLGTLLRTAEAVGAHGVVLTPHRGAGVSPAVVASSSGASEHLLIAQENLVRAMGVLQQAGAWMLGLERRAGAQRLDQVDVAGPLGVVVGSEGSGLRRLVREKCDFLAYLPMRGRVDSLNASVAGSIALHAIWQRRGYPGSEVAD